MNRISFSAAAPEAQLAMLRGLTQLSDLFVLTIYAGGSEIPGSIVRVVGALDPEPGVWVQRRDTKHKSETFVTLATITGITIV